MGLALGIQLALGGLVTFFNVGTGVHIVWGVVLGVLALVTLFTVLKTPGRPRRIMNLSVGIAVDILIQALLGFASLGAQTSNADLSNGLAWVHLLNAFAIFAMTIMATGMAMMGARMGQMGRGPPTAGTG